MRTEKSWGYEQLLHNGDYCAKLLVYNRTIASSLHYHVTKQETFYIARGCFEVEVGGLKMDLLPGEYVTIPAGTPHRVRCLELGVIVESSTHDDPNDCVRLVPSET